MFLFYVLSCFKNGDTIFKGGHYFRKYGIYKIIDFPKYHRKNLICLYTAKNLIFH